MNKLPVIVLSGFLGAGKTTLDDAEMAQGPQAWQRRADSFPVWNHDAQNAE